jgi:uncharacterized protein (DUF2249 family)
MPCIFHGPSSKNKSSRENYAGPLSEEHIPMTTSTATAPAGTAETIAAITGHHAQLSRDLAAAVVRVRDAVERLTPAGGARDELLRFVTTEVLPHAAAEEATLYAAGSQRPATELLVAAMVAEHRVLVGLVEELAEARTPAEIVGAASAVRAVFETHLAKENDLLLPALVADGVDIAAMLDGMHEILGGHDEAGEPVSEGGCGCGGCGCGGDSGAAGAADVQPGDLDVRPLPPAQRHEQIFTTIGRLEPGQWFVLANDHDPKPLRYQLEAEAPGQISWDYLQAGPALWRVRIGRVPAQA